MLKYSKTMVFMFFAFFSISILCNAQQANLQKMSGFDKKIKNLAEECREEVLKQFNLLLSSGRITIGQLFDTFYIPIPNTNPQKYNTQYDAYTDEVIRGILDKYLNKDEKIIFFVAVDRNGYLPTHNTKYARPLTGNGDLDVKQSRTKRIFNDRTGLSAAKNKEPYLLQYYERDTGEKLADFSIPIFVNGIHWGAIRVGYKRNN